ncbi:type II toxin-antitoxin system VapC family toxin [Candidatus Woesearchaeota archaeon]|nr:type II toxin-antitoxin system VapC family toxin [Candidatus Woesearchaeota archaeon]
MAVFLDASYFLAFYDKNDVHHERALLLSMKLDANEYGQSITSDYIFDETVSVALRKFGKENAQALGKQILGTVFIVQCDRHLFDASLEKFNSSKEPFSFTDCVSQAIFSFTDCVSQAIMDLIQIKYIVTFDKLFEKLDVEIIK